MYKLVLIAVAGGVGSLLRYLVAGLAQRLVGGALLLSVPAGTLLVNVTGSALLGFLACALPAVSAWPAEWRVALLVGGLGGFTTFSTFALETFRLADEGQWGFALLNLALNNALALAAAWLGWRLAERIYGVVS